MISTAQKVQSLVKVEILNLTLFQYSQFGQKSSSN
jgi:hypothetical protein